MKVTFEFYVNTKAIPYLKTELNDKIKIIDEEEDTCRIEVTIKTQNDIYCVFIAGAKYGLNKAIDYE